MVHTYRVCMVYDHVYSKLFVYRNSIPSNKMLTKYTDYTKVVDVYCFNSGHQESSQPFIMDSTQSSGEFPTIHHGLHVSASSNSRHAAHS